MNRRNVFWMAMALTICTVTVNQAYADGFIHIVPRPEMPMVTPMSLNYHKVEVQIDNQVTRTEVDEEFYNPNPRVLEGIYMFPVPKGASIDKFSMFIDGKETKAELIDAAKARSIYEDIVRRMKDPALLEYVDRDLFKVRVFPIPANGTKRIKLSYSEVLKTDSGLTRYVYPLNIEKFSSAPIKTLGFKLTLRSKFPIKNVYCPTHSMEITRKSDREVIVGYEASNVKPDRDVEILYGQDDKDVGVDLLSYKPAGEEGYFLCLLSPRVESQKGAEVPKDVCFVLDSSASMDDRGKIKQAQNALAFCLRKLHPGDRFNVVRFSTEAETLFDRLQPADQKHLDRGLKFVEKIEASGGTNINDAILQALKLKEKNNRLFLVVFLTDGLPTVGETNVDTILTNVKKANAAGTRIFCFGVGFDVNTKLLDRMAETTRAFSQYVKPDENMEVPVSSFYTKINDPVLSQIALKFNNVRIKDVYPHDLPDLFRGSQLIVTGRYEDAAKASIQLDGQINDIKKNFTYDAVFTDQAKDFDFIPRLWATQKVAYLLDEIRLHGQNKEVVDEATKLAKRFGIVTPYTSYLILEDERQLANARGGNPAMGPMMGPSQPMLPQEFRRNDSMGMATDTYNKLADKSGRGAVQASKSLSSMRASRPMAGSSADDVYTTVNGRRTTLASQVRHVADKTFFFNGNVWIDTQVPQQKNPKKLTIKYMSDDYFNLLREKPAIGKFLALGESVQVFFDGTVYIITK